MSQEAEFRAPFAAVLASYREQRRPRRNARILQTPTGFVQIRFWSRRRAWIVIHNESGWPARRLRRWVTRDHPSLARALRRGGFDAAEADRSARQISDEWGEPVGDVADVVIPAAIMFGLTATGVVVLGRWLLMKAGVRPRDAF